MCYLLMSTLVGQLLVDDPCHVENPQSAILSVHFPREHGRSYCLQRCIFGARLGSVMSPLCPPQSCLPCFRISEDVSATSDPDSTSSDATTSEAPTLTIVGVVVAVLVVGLVVLVVLTKVKRSRARCVSCVVFGSRCN